MLYRELLSNELHNQREDFARFAETQTSDLTEYLHILRQISELSNKEVKQKISKTENPGAIPSDELDTGNSFSRIFSESWENHEQARRWAWEILKTVRHLQRTRAKFCRDAT